MTAVKRTTDEALCRTAARLRLVYMRDHMVDGHGDQNVAPGSFAIRLGEGNRPAGKQPHQASNDGSATCTLESFDFSAQPALDQGIIRELTKLEWLDTGENALFLGPPGVSKR